VLSEQEVSKSWTRLFKSKVVDDEILRKAEALLNNLRPESPLRHRLATELEELQNGKP